MARLSVFEKEMEKKNTHKDEEIEDKHEVLDAAETVPLHGCPPCWSLSLPLKEKTLNTT